MCLALCGHFRVPHPSICRWRSHASPRADVLLAACVRPVVSAADGERCSRSRGGDGRAASSLFHLPPEFFHPATAVPQGSLATGGATRPGTSRLTSPASWASLRSPGAKSRVVSSQPVSHSESSLNTGNSEGSLHAMLEEGPRFSVSPPQDLTLAVPLVCPLHDESLPPPGTSPTQTSISALASRGHQRSPNSSGGNRQDSAEPSDEDTGIEDGSSKAFNSEHLSETLSSLSLSSLLTPGSLLPLLVKKCNSTGSLEQGSLSAQGKEGRQPYGMDQQQHASGTCPDERGEGGGESAGTGLRVKKSSSQMMDAGSRKDR